MVLGIGVGYHKTEFFALGVDFEERNALFDEVLEALPLHWSGEPFSYKGLHFDARDVVARPRPVQDPIPIWIGGNARISRRRAARHGQGWMPMPGGAELSTTARTVQIPDFATLGEMIAEVQRDAAEAGRPPIEIQWTYTDRSLQQPTVEADRHREVFAELESIGVTTFVVTSKTTETTATLDFIESFGRTYLS
jgi:alkanesulfonate monooxygenase SsuD/methylene tetrahydromethanopterin reductase-like flavin-dependent oxidoreductase (luciferase family)